MYAHSGTDGHIHALRLSLYRWSMIGFVDKAI